MSASSTLEHITRAHGAATRPSHVQTTRLLAQDNPPSRAAVAWVACCSGRKLLIGVTQPVASRSGSGPSYSTCLTRRTAPPPGTQAGVRNRVLASVQGANGRSPASDAAFPGARTAPIWPARTSETLSRVSESERIANHPGGARCCCRAEWHPRRPQSASELLRATKPRLTSDLPSCE